MLERTLLIVKPHAVEKNLVDEIIRRVEKKGYRVIVKKKLLLQKEEAEAFYEIHRGKPFFQDLVALMHSGPCVPMVVEGENVIAGVRELIGTTDPAKAAEGTIRKDFGEDVTRNCVHASDAPETAEKEICFFFETRRLV
jgi:nucleoside-diphosphate kinase